MIDGFEVPRIFTQVNGKRVATQMLLVMIAIASTDLLFALDSIPKISTLWSLLVIAAILITSTIASLIKVKKDPSAHAHAGHVVSLKNREQDADN
jgi:tellurite resistance protein TerC